MTKNKQQFDIVIAGGGLSGALSALSLASLRKNDGGRLSIAIIEANPILTDAKLSFDSRVLALSHQSAQFLASLNVWEILNKAAAPIQTIHISDRNYYGKARITAKEHQVSALGYVIEMSLLGQALITCLQTIDNITWYCPDTIEHIQWYDSHVDIKLDSNEQLSSSLLLACDGANSTCRQKVGIKSNAKSYDQAALITNLRMKKAHKNIAYERFTQTGPIAMLPLTDTSEDSHRCSLVWTLTPAQASDITQLSDEEFKLTLEQAFGSWLGAVEHVGTREVYSLALVQAQEQVRHRMVLIGNASHTIHPIAGQGFNLGLRDVEELTCVIQKALAKEQDIGQLSVLMDYAQNRKVDHQQVISITDSVVTLFSNDLLPMVIGRNIGLKALNYVRPFKNLVVDKLMGY